MLNGSFNTIDIQKKALDASWLRQSILSNNLANLNTPGYKRRDIDFESLLVDHLNTQSTQMTRTNTKHFSVASSGAEPLSPIIHTDRRTSYRLDGNNVNIDKEMAELATNQIKYNAMVKQVSAELTRLKTAIKGEV